MAEDNQIDEVPAAGVPAVTEVPTPEAPTTDAPEADVSGTDVSGLAALGALQEAQQAAVEVAPVEPIIDAQGRSYATGRRKNASARVWIKRGTGQITINGSVVADYFARPVLLMLLQQPFQQAERTDEFDVIATVKGGGLSGQAGAVRHGISRALIKFEPTLRPILKTGGFLTRDSRVVERKKYGKAKARRSFQFSKR